jgi:hypothetical protein
MTTSPETEQGLGTSNAEIAFVVSALNDALAAAIEQLNLRDDRNRIALSLGYATQFLGVLLAATPAKDEQAMQDIVQYTAERLKTAVVEARLIMQAARADIEAETTQH